MNVEHGMVTKNCFLTFVLGFLFFFKNCIFLVKVVKNVEFWVKIVIKLLNWSGWIFKMSIELVNCQKKIKNPKNVFLVKIICKLSKTNCILSKLSVTGTMFFCCGGWSKYCFKHLLLDATPYLWNNCFGTKA